MGKRLAYLLTGYGVGLLIGLALWSFTGRFRTLPIFVVGNTLGALFTWWAERRGRVKSIEEINRPLTLFPRN